MTYDKKATTRVTYSFQSSVGYWVTRLARSLEAELENRLAEYGMTRGSWAVLSAMAHHDKTTPAELSAFVGIDGAAITRHLDRIAKQGLITRRRGTKDRRSVTVKLTAKGAELVPKIAAESFETNQKFLSDLSPDEVDTLLNTIRKMLENGELTPSDL